MARSIRATFNITSKRGSLRGKFISVWNMLSSKDQKDVHVKMLIKKNTVAGGHHQDGGLLNFPPPVKAPNIKLHVQNSL